MGLQRDKHDARDYVFAEPIVAEIPRKASISCPPARNQLNLGSCASHAAIAAAEIYLLQKGKYVELSELYHYYYARKDNGTFPTDGGMTIRDSCKCILDRHFTPEAACPYDVANFNKAPGWIADAFAVLPFLPKAKSYERILLVSLLKAAVAKGKPVLCGITVQDGYYKVSAQNPVYRPNGAYVGGHAQLVVGYNDDTGQFRIRNSWGPAWGEDGYYYISYEDFAKISFDYWVINFE